MRAAPIHYCPRCGGKSFIPAEGGKYVCTDTEGGAPGCRFELYFNAAAAVAVIVTNKAGEVLLATRARDPGKGLLDLPGGFVDSSETGEAAALRELREEIGWAPPEDALKYLCSQPNVYPYRGVEYETLDIVYMCNISNNAMPTLRAADDVAALQWVPANKVQPQAFAFESLRAAWAVYRQR